MPSFLEVFLFVDIFCVGVLATLAIQHAYAHFRLRHNKTTSPSPSTSATEEIPEAVRNRMLQEAEAHFQTSLNQLSLQLQHDVSATATAINKLLGQLGAKVVGDELERYRVELGELRKHAEGSVDAIRNDLAVHESELKANMANEVAREKQLLLRQIDTKLADAVTAFLLETLQHNIDLGAQRAYLATMLEEHKDDFAKEVSDEAPAAK